jgi:hypothetical protein
MPAVAEFLIEPSEGATTFKTEFEVKLTSEVKILPVTGLTPTP